MSIPSDLSGRVSAQLAAVVRNVLDDPRRTGDATLDVIRHAMSGGLVRRMIQAGELAASDREALFAEVNRLIEEVGGDIPAVHLLGYEAPWPLTGVLEAMLERRGEPERAATLADVREAIESGLLTDLLADGSIDSDEDDEVLPQLDRLMHAHGPQALVEDFLGAEDESR